jgi:hypothetical protein
MKKLFFISHLIFTIAVFSQGWNSTVTTSIYDNNFLGMDLCTNRNGNNLVELSWNGQIAKIYYVKYFLLNSSGSVIRSSTIETLGPNNGSIEYVNIAGNNDKVHILYVINGIIRVKKSTDAGINWATYDLANPAGSGGFDYADIAFDNITNKLHVVYARGSFGYPNQITHYYSLNPDDQWGEYKKVSDYGDEWTKPTVSFSQNRVHVSYHEDGAISRDKYLTNWQTPATLASSLIERIHAGSSKLFYFYGEPQPELDVDLYVKLRNLDGSTWSSPTLLHAHSDFYPPFVSVTNTTDGKTHIVYSGPGSTVYRNYNGSTWTSELTIGDNYENPLISSASNDLYVIWMGTNNYVKYRQYDAIPLAPQGISVNPYQQGNNIYAKLTWQLNTEPDVFLKPSSAYLIERRIRLLDNPWGPWVIVFAPDGSVSEFIDSEVQGASTAESYFAEYRMRAVDSNNHYSNYSSTVMIEFAKYVPSSLVGGGFLSTNKTNFEKINQLNYDFYLNQNYPNPFNPTTQISYSIKSQGRVTLKVYDMLGTEVASLVNERKEPGSYSVTFNASGLPSGIYVYKLQAGNYSATKKLILLR